VYSRRDRRRLYKTFATHAAAKAWQRDASAALARGLLRAPTKTTVQQAAEEWRAGAKSGAIRNRSGDRYKPSAIRSYEAALKRRVLPEIGGVRLSEIRRSDLQDVADRMLAEDLDPSTIRNVLMPLRPIFRRAVSRGELALNPTIGLELPAVRGRRDRIASPAEAAQLLDALAESDRPIWATALYAGLRRGEILAPALGGHRPPRRGDPGRARLGRQGGRR
jgi:integrase